MINEMMDGPVIFGTRPPSSPTVCYGMKSPFVPPIDVIMLFAHREDTFALFLRLV